MHSQFYDYLGWYISQLNHKICPIALLSNNILTKQLHWPSLIPFRQMPKGFATKKKKKIVVSGHLSIFCGLEWGLGTSWVQWVIFSLWRAGRLSSRWDVFVILNMPLSSHLNSWAWGRVTTAGTGSGVITCFTYTIMRTMMVSTSPKHQDVRFFSPVSSILYIFTLNQDILIQRKTQQQPKIIHLVNP